MYMEKRKTIWETKNIYLKTLPAGKKQKIKINKKSIIKLKN